MKKQTSIYLNDRDFKNLETLRNVYDIDNNGQLISKLLDDESERVRKYKELLTNE